MTDTISFDPAVRKGRLSNGFSYYITRSTASPGKVALELTVKAGTVLQESDQVELAHVLEHLAFGNTRHFRSVFGYLDSLGSQRGKDVNGGTGVDETNYWVVVPADGGAVHRRSLSVMHDFAQGIIITPETVERERNVVFREVSGGGASYTQRFMDVYYPQILRHSQYAKTFSTYDARLRALRTFDIKSVSRFYEEWYRPNLQALIIVGDIDVFAVERQVCDMFSDLKNPSVCRLRPTFQVPLYEDNKFSILTDADVPSVEVQMLRRRDHKTCYTGADYKSRLEEGLYAEMMRVRCEEIQERYDQVFITLSHYDSKERYAGLDVLNTHIRLKVDDMKEGIQIVARELERVVSHGFYQHELDRAKRVLLTKREYVPPTNLIGLTGYYSANFTTGSAAPGQEEAKRLQENLSRLINLEDVHRKAVELIRNPHQDILIFAPVRDERSLPDEGTVLSWIDALRHEMVSPYQPLSGVDDRAFLHRLALHKGRANVQKRSYIKDVDITELRLSNGATVVLKSLKKELAPGHNDIKVYAFSRHRAPPVSDSTKYFSAKYTAEIVASNGLAGLERSELTKVLAKKDVSGGPFNTSSGVGFSGSSTVEQAELLFQLMCEYYRYPLSDEKNFKRWKKEEETTLNANRRDPQMNFWRKVDSLQRASSDDGLLADDPLAYVRRDVAYEMYKQQFLVDSDYVVVVVGYFDLASVIDLCTQYIGLLPSAPPGNRSHGKLPQQTVGNCQKLVKDIALGPDTLKADVNLMFEGPHVFSTENNLKLDAVQILLQDVLSHRLRDMEGAIYSVYVQARYGQQPIGRYRITISFSCHPDNVDRLVDMALAEVDTMAKGGITEPLLQSIIKKAKANMLTDSSGLDSWMVYLITQYENNGNPSEVVAKMHLWDRLNRTILEKAVEKYVKNACFSRFVLTPL